MKITAINGSPKKDGKISKIVEEIIKGAEEKGHQCRIIYLKDLSIMDCQSCGTCIENAQCINRDDIVKIEEAIKESDLLIFATPTHWANMSGYMVRMFERLVGFFIKVRKDGLPVLRNAKGKKVFFVTACSTPYPLNWLLKQSGSTFSRLKEICKGSGMKVVGKFALSGTIFRNNIPQKILLKARNIGRGLR